MAEVLRRDEAARVKATNERQAREAEKSRKLSEALEGSAKEGTAALGETEHMPAGRGGKKSKKERKAAAAAATNGLSFDVGE
jgi:DNA-binding protein H-NS